MNDTNLLYLIKRKYVETCVNALHKGSEFEAGKIEGYIEIISMIYGHEESMKMIDEWEKKAIRKYSQV